MKKFYCGLINNNFINKVIDLYGWVHNIRYHGSIIFIDLRDIKGIIQLVCLKKNKNVFIKLKKVSNEFCLKIKGRVLRRSKNNYNLNIKTGLLEILIINIKILSKCSKLPFEINEKKTNLSDEIRLKYRYLDLRRSFMQKNLKIRNKIVFNIRNFLYKKNFIEIETPFLTKSTPEGSRDYIIPSRLNIGKFFALPQSPQLFKQLLMISGFERYYQIVKCFRDEDLRKDRQPEFTQIDCEMSFVNEKNIRSFFENMLIYIFKKSLKIKLLKFPIIKFHDAIKYYGTDKPDLRIGIKIIEFKKKKILFNKFFFKKLNNVFFMHIPYGNNISKKNIDKIINININNNHLFLIKILKKNKIFFYKNNYIKFNFLFFKKIFNNIKINYNDIVILGIGKYPDINEILGKIRIIIGNMSFSKKYNIFKNKYCPVWIIDFPLFKYDIKTNKYNSYHHPFTSPKKYYFDIKLYNYDKIISQAYDLVINGIEIGGGSIRINESNIQKDIFKILGLNENDIKIKFGFLLKSLKFSPPPMGGIAIGLDRLISIITKSKSIRDVIAFPKTQKNQCLLTNSPDKINKSHLSELKLKINS